MKSKLLHILLIFFVVISPLSLSGCFKENSTITYKMDLEIWGVFDDSDAFAGILKDYRAKNPQIKEIRYRKVSADAFQYEKDLIEAFASNKGPDIFFFHNSWLEKHGDKIAAHPNSTERLDTFKKSFIDVAYDDFVSQGNIYAMPLECDTLALYYNKDLLNQAGITAPPRTWEEVISNIPLLTKIDQSGNINQSTIALGRSKDPGGINRSSDILMLLMLQSGVTMREGRYVSFERSVGGRGNLGEEALNFYTQFSRGSSTAYTWNAKMDYNIDSFRFGKTAMILNYSYLADKLKKSDPKLNFDVAAAPQLNLDKQVNFANYWGLAVAKNKTIPVNSAGTALYTQKDRATESWRFIQYLTTPPATTGQNVFDPTKEYLKMTRKVPARRDLIEAQKTDLRFGVFVNQALTAKSWKQPDNVAVEDIFVEMIDNAVSGKETVMDALRHGASRVNALIKQDL